MPPAYIYRTTKRLFEAKREGIANEPHTFVKALLEFV